MSAGDVATYSVPNCPWCGMLSRSKPEQHREWETVCMECGSEIYPPRATSPSAQSKACKEIAALRRQVEERETTIGAILESSEALMEYVDRPPERNCSCHISPPCSDCVENSHLRGAFERLDDARKMYNALRSGEAGKGAIYCGEHTAAEIPAILAAHPGYTLPSSHDF